ncbi:MAG: ATP-binding protein, partial [Alphaproteobacteria bacterium]|nr:ATP-binding protein [Alphaproteobacteria bacterium]
SPDGAHIRVVVQRSEDMVHCTINDSGVGMSAGQVETLFERFGSTGSARQSGTSGSGLGLALVKSVVERHHGTISCTSAPGKGTSFTLAFPESMAP